MAKVIGLTKGEIVLVDDEDYPALNQWKWSFHSGGYACRIENGKMILMHRFLLKAEDGDYVDHVNGKRWDNRRCNLRVATPQQSAYNTTKTNRNGYRGVTFHAGRPKPYQAAMRRNGRKKSLGYYVTAEEAARAYDAAAINQQGEYAKLNFPGMEAEPGALLAEIHAASLQWEAELRRQGDGDEWRCWRCEEVRPRDFDECPHCGADIVALFLDTAQRLQTA